MLRSRVCGDVSLYFRFKKRQPRQPGQQLFLLPGCDRSSCPRLRPLTDAHLTGLHPLRPEIRNIRFSVHNKVDVERCGAVPALLCSDGKSHTWPHDSKDPEHVQQASQRTGRTTAAVPQHLRRMGYL